MYSSFDVDIIKGWCDVICWQFFDVIFDGPRLVIFWQRKYDVVDIDLLMMNKYFFWDARFPFLAMYDSFPTMHELFLLQCMISFPRWMSLFLFQCLISFRDAWHFPQCMNFFSCNAWILSAMHDFSPQCMNSLSCDAWLSSLAMHDFFLRCMTFFAMNEFLLLRCMTFFPQYMNSFTCNAWPLLCDAWISFSWYALLLFAMHEFFSQCMTFPSMH